MNIWKSETHRPNGVWTSELRLRTASTTRKGKVNKLLARLAVREILREVKP